MIQASNVLSNWALVRYVEKVAFPVFKKNTFFWDMADVKRNKEKWVQLYAFNLVNPEASSLADVETTNTPWITPTSIDDTLRQVTVAMRQFINIWYISDVAESDTMVDLYATVAKEKMRKMAEFVDQVVQAELLTQTTQVVYWTKASWHTARTQITTTEILTPLHLANAFATLKANAVPFFDWEAGYVWVIHPFVANDLRTDVAAWNFYDAKKYTDPTTIFNGELGRLNGIRLVESPNTQVSWVWATSKNIYPTFIVGKEAYSIVIDENIQTLIVPRTPTIADPGAQRGSVTVKVRFNAKILRPESLYRIETSASMDVA